MAETSGNNKPVAQEIAEITSSLRDLDTGRPTAGKIDDIGLAEQCWLFVSCPALIRACLTSSGNPCQVFSLIKHAAG